MKITITLQDGTQTEIVLQEGEALRVVDSDGELQKQWAVLHGELVYWEI